jgi:hypothetical protein
MDNGQTCTIGWRRGRIRRRLKKWFQDQNHMKFDFKSKSRSSSYNDLKSKSQNHIRDLKSWFEIISITGFWINWKLKTSIGYQTIYRAYAQKSEQLVTICQLGHSLHWERIVELFGWHHCSEVNDCLFSVDFIILPSLSPVGTPSAPFVRVVFGRCGELGSSCSSSQQHNKSKTNTKLQMTCPAVAGKTECKEVLLCLMHQRPRFFAL